MTLMPRRARRSLCAALLLAPLAGAALLFAAVLPIQAAGASQSPALSAPEGRRAAFAFRSRGNVPGRRLYSYRIPRDDRAPWIGNRPWLEITKEAADWAHAGTFTTVTVVDNPAGFYLMDLYIHGDEAGGPVVRVSDIDIRRYLPQPVPNAHSCIAQVQVYLGEYNRKSRSITRTIPGLHESASNISKVDLINNCREPGNWEFNIHETVDGKQRRVLHGYFFVPIDYLDARQRRYTGYGWRDARVGLRFPRDPVTGEPNAQVPASYTDRASYRSWLAAAAVNRQEERADKDLAMTWWALPSFPQACRVDDLKAMFTGLPNAVSSGVEGELRPLKAESGPIDYSLLPSETRGKSGIAKRPDGTPVRQTLSYVRTRACRAIGEADGPATPPEGFAWPLDPDAEPPADRQAFARERWNDTCAIVPHTFRNWEDVTTYAVRVSGFEGDGTYGCAVKGATPREQYAHRREKFDDDLNCWRFAYHKYLKDFEKYRIARRNGFTEVYLHNTSGATLANMDSGRSVVIGFPDERLRAVDEEGLHFLLGYNSKKLSAAYDDADVDPALPHYAYVVDRNGNILDHYGPSNMFKDGVGIGKVQVRLAKRDGKKEMVVTLISHERIMPLAQFRLPYDVDAAPHEQVVSALVGQGNVLPSAAPPIGLGAILSEAQKERMVERFEPGEGETVLAQAILSHGMSYHAVILRTPGGTKLRRFQPDGTPHDAGVSLVRRGRVFWSTDSAYGERYRLESGGLAYYDHNGLVARAPLIGR